MHALTSPSRHLKEHASLQFLEVLITSFPYSFHSICKYYHRNNAADTASLSCTTPSPSSLLHLRQKTINVSVPSVPCPMLIVFFISLFTYRLFPRPLTEALSIFHTRCPFLLVRLAAGRHHGFFSLLGYVRSFPLCLKPCSRKLGISSERDHRKAKLPCALRSHLGQMRHSWYGRFDLRRWTVRVHFRSPGTPQCIRCAIDLLPQWPK